MVGSFSDASFTSISFTTVTVAVPVGGGSGGRVKKKVGQQLTDLGPRPHGLISGESISKLLLKPINKSKSKLTFLLKAESIWIPLSIRGHSIAKLLYKTKYESRYTRLYYTKAESSAVWHPTVPYVQEKMTKIRKLMQVFSLFHEIESIDDLTANPDIKSFEFNEQVTDPILKAFTASSSFVGNVRYNRETQGMRILLNGKPFNFCNVPERVFDAFEGANSKGAFFARNIRTQFDC